MKTLRYGVFVVLLLLPSLLMARTRKSNDGEPQTLAELLEGLSLASPSQWYQGMPFVFLNERVGLSLTAEVPAEASDTANMRGTRWFYDSMVSEEDWMGQQLLQLRFI